MTTPYVPSDTRHNTITLPSDGDAASGAIFQPPHIQIADNAEVALLRHDISTIAAVQAETGMPDGTSRTVVDAGGYTIGTFYYRAALNKAGSPWAIPQLDTKTLFLLPLGADTGVWVHEDIVQSGNLGIVGVGCGVFGSFGTEWADDFAGGGAAAGPRVKQTGVTGTRHVFDVTHAWRRGVIESITVDWLPSAARAAVPAVNPKLQLNGIDVLNATFASAQVSFGPTLLADWNAGVRRFDVVSMSLLDTASLGDPSSMWLSLYGENGANSQINDAVIGFTINYRFARAGGQ